MQACDVDVMSVFPAAHLLAPVRVSERLRYLQGDVSGVSVDGVSAGEGGVGRGVWREAIQHAHSGHLRCAAPCPALQTSPLPAVPTPEHRCRLHKLLLRALKLEAVMSHCKAGQMTCTEEPPSPHHVPESSNPWPAQNTQFNQLQSSRWRLSLQRSRTSERSGSLMAILGPNSDSHWTHAVNKLRHDVQGIQCQSYYGE